MHASFLDLRRRMKDILRALDRRQDVTITYRGKPRAVLKPLPQRESAAERSRAAEHEAFGMWSDREDLQDVATYVRRLREGRYGDLRH